jgi:hypothetical protein
MAYVSADKIVLLSRAFCHEDTRYCTELICINDEGEINWLQLLDSISYIHRQSLMATNEYIYIGGKLNNQGQANSKVLQFNWSGELISNIDLNNSYPLSSIHSINQIDSSVILTLHKQGDNGLDYSVPDTVYFHFMDQALNYQRHFSYTSGSFAYESGGSLVKAQDGSGYYCDLFGDSITRPPLRNRQLILLKFDLAGNLLWTYPTPPDAVFTLPDLVATPDGGAAMIWTVNNFDVQRPENPTYPTKLYKISSEGVLEWERLIYTPGRYQEFGTSLLLANNGDFIVVGEEYGDAVHGEINSVNAGWLARVSPAGDIKWVRNVYDDRIGPPLGERLGMSFRHGTELPNGDLMLIGLADDAPPPGTNRWTNTNTWVVRTDSMGCIHPGCERLDVVTSLFPELRPTDSPIALQLWPNPAGDLLNVAPVGPTAHEFNCTYRIVNSQGQVVRSASLSLPTQVPLTDLPAGYYQFQAWQQQTLLSTQNFVKL